MPADCHVGGDIDHAALTSVFQQPGNSLLGAQERTGQVRGYGCRECRSVDRPRSGAWAEIAGVVDQYVKSTMPGDGFPDQVSGAVLGRHIGDDAGQLPARAREFS